MASVISFRTVLRRLVLSIPPVALATRVSWLRLLPMRPSSARAFDERRIYWFEVAPDGNTLVIARAELTRDAVLIENFLPAR